MLFEDLDEHDSEDNLEDEERVECQTVDEVDIHEGVNVKHGEDEKEKGDKFKAGLKDSEQ